MKNTGIRVTELDFDKIKDNLKTYLKSQSYFQDYEFEASGLSTLLDVLAYNTHYNAILANYQANEMFLDSALRRDSVISLAKNLGYTAKSRRAAYTTALLTLTSVPGNPDSVFLPPGQKFTTQVKDISYTFTNVDSSVAYRTSGNQYIFSGINLYEGKFYQHRFPAYTGLASEKFIIPNQFPDTTSIRMMVYSSGVDTTGTPWQQAPNILDIDSNSNVFFIQPTWDNKYEIYFGDGVLGARPDEGSIIQIQYITTSGAGGNGAKVFTFAGSISGSSAMSVSAQFMAKGGEDEESIDKIKFNAQTVYSAQNRAVTAEDYRSIIRTTLSGVRDVITYGGEEAIPPQYGAVMISVIPEYGDYLTESEKTAIQSVLRTKAVANTRFNFIDPQYLNIVLSSTVYLDKLNLSKSPSQVASTVKTNIIDYANNYLNRFNNIAKYSQIVTLIDDSDVATTSNDTTLTLYYNLFPNTSEEVSYSINVFNQISASIYTTTFSVVGVQGLVYFKSVGTDIHLYNTAGNIVKRNVGLVTTKGMITINPIYITSYSGEAIRFYMTSLKKDIVGSRLIVLQLDPADITITALMDTR